MVRRRETISTAVQAPSSPTLWPPASAERASAWSRSSVVSTPNTMGTPVASWARYAEGTDEWGKPYEVLDQLADSLIPIARSHHESPTAFIEVTAVFSDLAHQPRFVEAYRWALDSLHHKGARATLAALVQ